jgi:hypothetical protein
MPNYHHKEIEDMVKLLENIFEKLGGSIHNKKKENLDEFDSGRLFVLESMEKTKKMIHK